MSKETINSFAGKRALITGASSGLGLEFASGDYGTGIRTDSVFMPFTAAIAKPDGQLRVRRIAQPVHLEGCLKRAGRDDPVGQESVKQSRLAVSHPSDQRNPDPSAEPRAVTMERLAGLR